MSAQLDQLCINTVRFLSVDAVQKAKSGHPGMPLGAAPMAYVLWTRLLKHNPRNPGWFDRDRFVLSAGHGSMLLYAIAYLTGYKKMTIEELEAWQEEFDAFHARFADLFERSESREQARTYLRGLLTEAQRKNSWQMAEAVGEPIPDRMQRLLYRVPWDADAARDRLQQFVIETFGDPEGIGIVDETGFLKKGTHSVGVARQ